MDIREYLDTNAFYPLDDVDWDELNRQFNSGTPLSVVTRRADDWEASYRYEIDAEICEARRTCCDF